MRRHSLVLWAVMAAAFSGYLLGAGALAARQPWATRVVRDAAAQEIARRLGVQVVAGPVEGNVLRRLTIHGLAAGRSERLPGGFVLAAARARVTYRPWDLIVRRGALAGRLEAIEVDDIQAQVERGEGGITGLSGLSSRRKHSHYGYQGPRVSLREARLHYLDRQRLAPDGQPLEVLVTEGNASFGLGGLVEAARSGRGEARDLALRGRVQLRSGTQLAQAEAQVAGSEVVLQGVAFRDAGAGDWLRVPSLQGAFDLVALIGGRVRSASTLRWLRAEQPQGSLSLDASGHLNALKHVERWSSRTPKPGQTEYRLEITGGRIVLRDPRLGPGSSGEIELAALEAQLNMGKVDRSLHKGRTESAGSLRGRLTIRSARLHAEAALRSDVTTRLDLRDLRASEAGRRLALADELELSYDLGQARRQGVRAGLHRAEADGLRTWLSLDRGNRPTFMAGLTYGSSSASRQPPPIAYALRLRLINADMTAFVTSAGRPGTPLRVRLVTPGMALNVGAWQGAPEDLGEGEGFLEAALGRLKGAGRVALVGGHEVQVSGLQVRDGRHEALRISQAALVTAPSANAGLVLREVALDGVRADLVLGRNGRATLLDSVLPVGSRRATPRSAGSALPRVSLQGGDLALLDRRAGGSGITWRARGVGGVVDLAAIDRLRRGQRASDVGGVHASLSAAGAGLRIGASLDADLDGRLALSQIALETTPGGDSIHLRKATAAFAPGLLLDGQLPASVRALELSDGHVRLVRGADGRLGLARALSGMTPRPRSARRASVPWSSLWASVRVDGVSARLVDHSARPGPVVAALEGLAGTASLRHPGRGELRASLLVRGPGMRAAAAVRTDLASWARVQDAALWELARGSARRLLGAREVTARYALSGLLAGHGTRAIRALDLRSADILVERERDGGSSLQRVAGTLAGAPGGRSRQAAEEAWDPWLDVHDSRVTYRDGHTPGGPTTITIRRLGGTTRLAGLWGGARNLTRRRSTGALRGQVSLVAPELRGTAAVTWRPAGQLSAGAVDLQERRGREWVRAADVRRVTLGYDPARLGGSRPADALRQVWLVHPQLDLLRAADGTLAAGRLAQALAHSTLGDPGGRASQPDLGITVWGGELRYLDQALTRGRGPLEAQASALSVRLPAGQLQRVLQGLPAEGVRLAGQLQASWPEAEFRGAVDTDLGWHAEMRDGLLQSRTAPAPRLTARHVAGRVALAGVVRGHVPPLAALDRLRVVGLDGELCRDRAGTWDIAALFDSLRSRKAADAPGTSPVDGLHGRLWIADTRLLVTDQKLNTQGPVSVSLEDGEGEVDLGRAGEVVDALRERQRGTAAQELDLRRLGRLRGRLVVQAPGGRVAALVDSRGLDAGVRLEGVELSDANGRERARARSLDVVWDLGGAVSGHKLWLESLRRAAVDGASVAMARERDGRLDIAGLIRGFGEAGGQPEARSSDLLAQVTVSDTTVQWEDRAAPGGPVVAEVRGLSGTLDGTRLAAVRQGKDLSGVGRLRGMLQARIPGETLDAGVDWNLDGSLQLTDLRALAPGATAPRLWLDRAVIGYDPVGLLGAAEGRAASVEVVSLGTGRVTAWQGAGGHWTVSRILEAYQQTAEAGPSSDDELGGLRARVQATAVDADVAGHTATGLPLRVSVRGVSGDVGLERLAAVRDGISGPSPGWARGQVDARLADARLSTRASVDLAGSASLEDLLLTDHDGARTVGQARQASVRFDPAQALRRQPTPAGLLEVAVSGARGEVVVDESGRWELARLFPAADAGAAGPPWTAEDFTSRVRLGEVTVTYRNRAPSSVRIPQSVTVRDLDGEVDLGTFWLARRTREPLDPGEISGGVEAVWPDARAVTRFSSDLVDDLELWDTDFTAEVDGRRRCLVSACHAQLMGRLAEALVEGPSLTQLRSLEAWDLTSDLTRRADGRLALPASLEPAADDGAAPQPLRLAGRVTLHRADLNYEDESFSVPGGLLVGGRELEGTVDLDALQAAADGRAVSDAGELRGRIAGRFGRYTAHGAVRLDAAQQLEAHDLTVREGFSGPSVVTALSLSARYDLGGLLARRGVWSQVSEIAADGLAADLVREADGSLRVAQGMKVAGPPAEGPGDRFEGTVRLTDSRVSLVDYAAGRTAPLEVSATGVSGLLRAGALTQMREDGQYRDAGELRATIAARLDDLQGQASVEGRISEGFAATGVHLSAGGDGTSDSLSVPRLMVQYDLGRALQGSGRDWAAHVTHVALHEADGRLTREPDGRLRLERLLNEALAAGLPPDPGATPQSALDQFAGRLSIENSRLALTDHALLMGEQAELRLGDVFADVDLGALRGGEPGSDPAGVVSADVDLAAAGEEWSAVLSGALNDQVSLSGLAVRSASSGQTLISAGRAGLRLDVARLVGQPVTARSFAEALREIDLDAVQGTLRRDAAGRWASPALLAALPASKGGDDWTPGAVNLKVRASQVGLRYEREAAGAGPTVLEILGAGGAVSLRGDLAKAAAEPLEVAGVVRGQALLSTPDSALQGGFETDLFRSLRLTEATGRAADGTELLRARVAGVSYDLRALLAGERGPSILRSAELEDGSAALSTTSTGDLMVAGIAVGGVHLEGEASSQPITLGTVTGDIVAGEDGVLRGQLAAGGPGSLLGEARAELMYDPADDWLDVEGEASDLRLADLGRLLVPADRARVTGGTAALHGAAYGRLRSEGARVAWSVGGEVADGQAQVARMGEQPVSFAGPVAATSEGVRTKGLSMAWGGCQATVTGGLVNLREPVLSLDVTGQAARGTDLLDLLPPAQREQTQALLLSRPVELRARVAGPPRAAACELELATAGDVVLAAGRAGALRLKGVDLRALALDWSSDDVQATAGVGAITVERDGSVTDALAQLESGAVLPSATRAQVRLAQGAQGLLQVQLQAPWARLRGVVGTGLDAEATVDGREVQVSRLEADLLGGRLRGAGSLDLGKTPGTWGQGRLELVGAQLEQLRALDAWPSAVDAQGEVNAVAQGAVGGAQAGWGLQARVTGARLNGVDYERAGLVAHGSSAGFTLDLAEVGHGEGRLWARGTARRGPDAPQQGPLGGLTGDLHLAAVDFPLSGFPGLGEKDWAQGALYATASLTGALADPDALLEADVFGLSAQTGDDSVAAVRLVRQGPELRVAHIAAAVGRSALIANDVVVNDFGLDWSREGRWLPRVDGHIVQGPVQGAGRAADIARVVGESHRVGGWAGLAGEVGGSLRQPRLAASVTVSNLQAGEWLLNQGELEAELADDYLVVNRATVRSGDTTAAFMGRVDDVYRGRNYNLVGSVRELALEQLPPVQRLDADVRGRADVTRVALWGRRGESLSGSATVNLELTRLGTQRFRPFTSMVQFSGGLVRLEATRIRRAVAAGTRDTASGFIGLSALFAPSQRVVEAELRLSGPGGVTETRAVSPEQTRALPDVASTLALAAPLVQAAEMSARERDEKASPKTIPPAAVGRPLWQSLTSLSLRTAGRVAGRLRIGGPLDDLYCSGALRLWEARLDGRALPRDISARADVALQDRRLENIALKAIDGTQELELTGSADLPIERGDSARRQLALAATGKQIDVPIWRHWLPGAVVLGGTAGFEIVVSGATGSPTVRGSLEIRNPSGAGARFDRLTVPQVEVSEGAVRIDKAELVRAGGDEGAGVAGPDQRVAVSGSLPWTWGEPWVPPDKPLDLSVTVRGPDLGFLPALLNDVAAASAGARRRGTPSVWASLRTGGAVDAEVAVAGTPRVPELSGHVTVDGGFVQGRTWDTPLDQVRLVARLDNEGGRTRLVADTMRARWGNTLAEADGSWAYLDQLAKGQATENEYHAEMRLRLAEPAGGAAALRPMTVAGVRLGGLEGKVIVNTLSQAMAGVPGSTSSRVHRLSLDGLTALMDVPQTPRAGAAGTGTPADRSGALRASGWMELSDLRPARIALNRHDLTLKADNALVRARDMLVGRLNGSLRATRAFGPGGLVPGRATGKVEGKLILSDAEIGGKLPGGGRRGQARALPASYASPAFDVRLAVGPGVRVSGMGAYVPLAQAEIARFSGTLQEPLLQGRVTAVSGSGSGRVSLPAGAVDVRSGWLDYRLGVPPGVHTQERMPIVLTGSLQAEGSTRIAVAEGGGTTRSYDVGLVLTGTLPDRINLEVDDVAGLTRDQILAHLGTAPLGGLSAAGQRVEDLISERALSLLAAGLRTTLLAPLETEVMRRLGLSELTINYGANQEFEVAVGKYVLRDLQIAYRRAVGGSAGDRYTLSLSYRLKNRLMVAYTTNELSESHVRVSYVTDY